MILDQLEKAFMVIGDKVMSAGSKANQLDEFDLHEDTVLSEVVVRPRPTAQRPYMETRKSLNNKTKQNICELAEERYGVPLSLRTEKKQLITQYLELQDNITG